MLAPVLHVLPMTKIRRHRLLPVTGNILVRKGQTVTPTEVIGEANLEPHHILIDVALGLGVGMAEADKYIERNPGEKVSEGDVLAGPVGYGQRVIRAPSSGKILLSGRGKILIEEQVPPYQLLAGLPGEVISLIPGRGAVIESSGALVQGVWGNGKINSAEMRVLISQPEDVFSLDQIVDDFRDLIILTGFCGDERVLKSLAELPVRGLVLSSMAASMIPLAEEMPYPIIVLEGFGLLAMNSRAFNLLVTSNQREITINAEKLDTYQNQRPEIFITLPVKQMVQEPKEATTYSPGQRVRIVRAPYQAKIGTLVALRPGLERLPNGIQAPLAEVELAKDVRVKLPLANLEVLE